MQHQLFDGCLHLPISDDFEGSNACYNLGACPEDRATLGSDPSAEAGEYTNRWTGAARLPLSYNLFGTP